jgi:cytochrome c oxidase cbb3-type subunit 2
MNHNPGWWRRAGHFAFATVGLLVLGVSPVGAQKDVAAAVKNGKSGYAALAEAPEKARARKNPFEGEPEAVAAGGKLFEQHCAECHGQKAGGTRHGVSLLGEEVQNATPGTLFWVLTNGVVRRGMPVWSKLPEPERWQIVTFLRSLAPQSLTSRPRDPQSAGSQSQERAVH